MDVKTIYFGTQPWCDFRAEGIVFSNGSTQFTLCTPAGTQKITLPVLGIHNVTNALAGLAVAQALGVPLNQAAEKLAGYQPLAMRQQIHYVNEITIIDDSYNASPDSMHSSLDVLCSFHGGKGLLCLRICWSWGFSQQAHFDVGVYAARSGVDLLITVGGQSKKLPKVPSQSIPD